jgi:hypothetical protein
VVVVVVVFAVAGARVLLRGVEVEGPRARAIVSSLFGRPRSWRRLLLLLVVLLLLLLLVWVGRLRGGGAKRWQQRGNRGRGSGKRGRVGRLSGLHGCGWLAGRGVRVGDAAQSMATRRRREGNVCCSRCALVAVGAAALQH